MEIASLDGPLPHYDAIYVAPHLDDAVYSCAAHIRSLRKDGKRVLVLTAFTGAGDSEKGTLSESLAPFLSLDARRDEDHMAMRDLDVDYHHMGLEEVLLRHGSSSSWFRGSFAVARAFVAGLVRSDKDVQLKVVQQLRKVLTKTNCPWLIGPAAIGFHPDHLLVHKACSMVSDQVSVLWHYHDFPYHTYPGLTLARTWMLELKKPVKEVQLTLTSEQVDDRERLLAMYASQTKVCFGTDEELESAVRCHPYERFLEVQRHGDEEGGVVPTLPVSNVKCVDSARRILGRMLLLDVIASLTFFFYQRNCLDWEPFSPRACHFAYLVIFLSALRASILLLMPALSLGGWLCVSSMCCTAAAFSSTAGVRCMSLFGYYSLQMGLGYVEQKFAAFVRWQMRARTGAAVDNRTKVLVVSDYMPPQTHGISTHAHGIVTALRDAGCLVHVYTTTGEPSEDHHLMFSMKNPFNTDVRLAMFPSLRLLRVALFGDWDIVHMVFPSMCPWPVLFLAWLSGKPIYISQHVNEALGRVYVPWPIYYLGLFTYLLISGLPVALFSTINAAPYYGYIGSNPFMRHYSPKRLAVVPSSVDAARFHSDDRAGARAALLKRLGLVDEQPLWLLVSRLAPEKDVSELLKALKHHLQEKSDDTPAPVLVIAGDGPMRKELEEEVRKDNLPVRFLGFVPHKEVSSLYRACDVCATNSVHETFGLTVIESLACGTPMVMPHCAVFDELYGDVLSDIMYTKGDVADLTRALCTGARRESSERIVSLRKNNGFNPNLFWSWKDAAVEQMAQYRRAQEMVRSSHRCLSTFLRTLLVMLSLATMVLVVVFFGP